jgi:dihydroorotase
MKTFYLILFLALLSCDTKKDNGDSDIRAILPTLNHDPENGYILIIPIDGCGVCVTKGVDFSKKHITSQKIRFVLTTQSSLKVIYRHYTEDEIRKMVIDSSKKVANYGYIKNGHLLLLKVVSNEIQSELEIQPSDVDSVFANVERNIR